MERTKTVEDTRQRPDMRTICMSSELWLKTKELALSEGRSISSFLRETVKQLHRKKKLKEEDESAGN